MAVKFTKELTELVNKLGDTAHTIDNDGVVITKNEALIELLWNTALGYKEQVMVEKGKDKGKTQEVTHKPQKWAMELIYNRKEGGLAAVADSGDSGMTAAKTVRQLVKDRLKRITRKIVHGEEENHS